MANPTVKSNFALIQELQENQGMLIAWAQNSIEKLVANQTVIAEVLDQVLTVIQNERLSTKMLTYRSKWKATQEKLKEIIDAQNTDE